MPDDRESASGQALDARQTAMQLENAAAAVAVKVVMVGFSGTLVDRGGADLLNQHATSAENGTLARNFPKFSSIKSSGKSFSHIFK